MLYAVVHVCVMNNILMIIITLHSIEKSSNNISPIYLNKSTDNSRLPNSTNRLNLNTKKHFVFFACYNHHKSFTGSKLNFILIKPISMGISYV